MSKKCREDVTAAEDIIAIAHDDDLQFIDGVVRPSQMLELLPEVNRSARCTSVGNPDCGCSREFLT